MAVQKKQAKVKKGKPAAKKAAAKAKAKKVVKPIPDNYPRMSPFMTLERCGEAIEFYKKVFGAKERMRMPMPDGKVAHAELTWGDSLLMLGEAMPPQWPVGTARLSLYVKDVDAVYKAALDAGAKSKEEPKNQFYGDRSAKVIDPFGAEWTVMTHVEDVSMKEMNKRMAAMGPPPGAEGQGQPPSGQGQPPPGASA